MANSYAPNIGYTYMYTAQRTRETQRVNEWMASSKKRTKTKSTHSLITNTYYLVEGEWHFCVVLKINNIPRFAEKGSGHMKLYIYSLNDTRPSWLQLMIEKMWVVVTCSTCSLVTHWLVYNGFYWQYNYFVLQFHYFYVFKKSRCIHMKKKLYYLFAKSAVIVLAQLLTPAVG